MNSGMIKKAVFNLVLWLLVVVTAVSGLSVFALSKADVTFRDPNYVDTLMFPQTKNHLSGKILDRNERILAQTVERQVMNDEGELETVYRREYTEKYAKATASLVGYSSPFFGSDGIERKYAYWLNPAGGASGGSVQLTIDAELQLAIYDLLANKYESGSAVVIDIQTGEILAMTDTPSYNQEALNVKDFDWDDYPRGTANRLAQTNATPGSVWKIATAVVLADYGYAGEVYTDKGVNIILGRRVKNYGGAAFGDITIEDAINYSSNLFFAEMSKRLGAGRLWEAYNKLWLIDQPIACDFGTIGTAECDLSTEDNFLRTSYGEGTLSISNIRVAMIAAAVASKNGEYFKPYAVMHLLDENMRVKHTGKKEVIDKNAVSKEAREVVLEGMKRAARRYRIDAPVKVAAKTGTASSGKGKNNISMIAVFPADKPKYLVSLMAYNAPAGSMGGDLKPMMEEIIELIV